MKIKLLFLGVVLVGAMTSFTAKLAATGGLKVKIELPAGVKADLEDTPIELFKTIEDMEDSKSVKSGWTNAAGEGTIEGVEAGTYYLDAMVETDDAKVYYGTLKVDIKSGVTGSVVLKLERNTELEDYEDDEE